MGIAPAQGVLLEEPRVYGPCVRVRNVFAAEVDVEVTTDASPYGLGAWITVNGVIKEWFAEPISETDESA